MRHGQSTWNQTGRWQGQADPPLSELGRRQAEAVAARLGRLGRLEGTVLHTSDLARCQQTAAPLAAALGVPARPRADLREIDIGAWSGLTTPAIKAGFPAQWAGMLAGQDLARGGGETFSQLRARVVPAIQEIVGGADGPATDAVVVTHGGCIRAIVTAALGLEFAFDLRLGGTANASISALRPLPPPAVGFRLESYNDVGHLNGLGR